MTLKSLAEATVFNVAPRNDILGFCGSLLICLVPRKRSLALSGFMSMWFSQHHWVTLTLVPAFRRPRPALTKAKKG